MLPPLPRIPLLTLLVAAAIGCKSTSGGEPMNAGGVGGEHAVTSCDFGHSAEKCGGTAARACAPSLVATQRECGRDDECARGELCFDNGGGKGRGTCQEIVGECVELTTRRNGDRFGASCDPRGKDTCAGRCVPVGNSGAGECEEPCRVGARSGCGVEDLSKTEIACAFFAFDLTDAGIAQGAGDLGICAALCNCDDECPGGQTCLDNPVRGFRGVCAGGLGADASLPHCPEHGIGGAGGAPG